jgi:GntR family transcriptional regulator
MNRPSKSIGDADASSAPLYEQIATRLRERLLIRDWRPGMMIPSEQQLASDFGVSQGTVRKAIEALVAEDALTRRQGAGTFVSELTERRSLYLYFNFIRTDGTRAVPESRLLRRSAGTATREEATALGLPARGRVLRFERVRMLGSVPVLVETVVVSEAMFPGLGAGGELPNHLFRHYETKYGVSVMRANERLSAVRAGKRDATLLGVDAGAPLLAIERVAFALDGRAVELRNSRCNTARHQYVAQRGGQLPHPAVSGPAARSK